jgi:transposase
LEQLKLLPQQGNIAAESKALMMSLFLIVGLIRLMFLENTTKKDSKNSSIPSLQTEKDESSLNHQGSNGKGKKKTMRWLKIPEFKSK